MQLFDLHSVQSSAVLLMLLMFYASLLPHREPQRESSKGALMSEWATAKFPSAKASRKKSCLLSVSTGQVVTP